MLFLLSSERYLQEKKLAAFFEKGYGISLLGQLYKSTIENLEHGTYDIYLNVSDPKPQYPAFRDFLMRLRRLNLVTLVESNEKKTRKLPRLKNEVIELIDSIEKELFENILVNRAQNRRNKSP